MSKFFMRNIYDPYLISAGRLVRGGGHSTGLGGKSGRFGAGRPAHREGRAGIREIFQMWARISHMLHSGPGTGENGCLQTTPGWSPLERPLTGTLRARGRYGPSEDTDPIFSSFNPLVPRCTSGLSTPGETRSTSGSRRCPRRPWKALCGASGGNSISDSLTRPPGVSPVDILPSNAEPNVTPPGTRVLR
jgi:hypothetical protein